MKKKRSLQFNAIIDGIKQGCTVLFPLITIPYVSRVLGTENYGKVSFSSSVMTYFLLIAALGITVYAVREGTKLRENRAEFQTFADEIFTINIITTGISYLCLILMLVFWKRVRDYRVLILLQSMVLLFSAVGTEWINVIYEDFLYTTVRYLAIQVLCLAAMFIFVRTPEDYLYFAGISAFAYYGGNLVNLFYIRKTYLKVHLTRRPRFRKHIGPMIFLFGNMLATTIYVNSDVTLLTLFKGDGATGIYSIATNIYALVKQVFNAMVGVALPRFALFKAENDRDGFQHLLRKVLHAVIALILPAAIGLIMLSEEIMVALAGPDYASGKTALSFLAVALCLAAVSYVFVYAVMITYRMEKLCLISTLIAAAVNLSLNFWFIPRFGMSGAAVTTIIAEILVLGLSLFFSRKIYRRELTVREMLPCAAGCIAIAALCFFGKKALSGALLRLLILVPGSMLLYGGCLILFRDTLALTVMKRVLASVMKVSDNEKK